MAFNQNFSITERLCRETNIENWLATTRNVKCKETTYYSKKNVAQIKTFCRLIAVVVAGDSGRAICFHD
jgi:hypothetical protein